MYVATRIPTSLSVLSLNISYPEILIHIYGYTMYSDTKWIGKQA